MERPCLKNLPQCKLLKTVYRSNASPTVIELYEDESAGIHMILKRLQKSRIYTSYQLESAKREIMIHNMLHHPNLVELYDSSETEDEFLLLMEFIPRHDYFTEKIEVVRDIQNNKPFNMKPDGGVEKLRSFSFDILRGLSFMHLQRVVHMDMKPANLMVKPVDRAEEYPLVKIADFGLSRLVNDDGLVEIEKRCGTDKFIAPEVRDGATISCAVDMWAFGMILHLLAVGFLPYALKWAPGQPLKFMPRHWRKYEQTGLIDLIELCLKLEPEKRIKADEALLHNWFSCTV